MILQLRSPSPRLRIPGGTIAVFPLLALVTGCTRAEATEENRAALEPFPVASPTIADAFVERAYVSDVRAARYAEIRARVAGIVENVAVDEGDTVGAGQHLFSIGARALEQNLVAARAAVAETDAELQAARLEHESTLLLFNRDVVSAAALGKVKAKVRGLEAKLLQVQARASQAEIRVGYTTITAPFGGTLDRIPKRLGSAVEEGELLTTIADASEVHAYFRIPERDYLHNRAQLEGERSPEVWLRLADGSVFPNPGNIDAVTNQFDQETGTITLRARFQNPAGLLKHGSSGKVLLKTKIPNALLVPQAATFEVQGHIFVYTVDVHDVVHPRRILPKARPDEHFVVESGLTTEDRFVLEGAHRLDAGAKIRVASPEPIATAG